MSARAEPETPTLLVLAGLKPPGADLVLERLVVLRILPGVSFGKLRNRTIERLVVTKVGRKRYGISGLCMSTGKQLGAGARIPIMARHQCMPTFEAEYT
jgi:hypothetical protein